jgi:lipopolysaccharide export LptBFGC system permease protein LptF
VGLPLAVSVRPSGKSIGVIIAFALILIYEWMLRTGYTMVETDHVLGVFMIFLPNTLFLVAGLFLWRQSLRA